VQIVGDDLFVTTLARVQAGIAAHEADAVLVKVNQAGTLADALDVVRAARSAGWSVVVSARSGDTEESWLADLAVGSGADQIKVGSTTRSERTSKWNRLLELEALDALPFVTPLPLPRSAPR
jgi:enolase